MAVKQHGIKKIAILKNSHYITFCRSYIPRMVGRKQDASYERWAGLHSGKPTDDEIP